MKKVLVLFTALTAFMCMNPALAEDGVNPKLRTMTMPDAPPVVATTAEMSEDMLAETVIEDVSGESTWLSDVKSYAKKTYHAAMDWSAKVKDEYDTLMSKADDAPTTENIDEKGK